MVCIQGFVHRNQGDIQTQGTLDIQKADQIKTVQTYQQGKQPMLMQSRMKLLVQVDKKLARCTLPY